MRTRRSVAPQSDARCFASMCIWDPAFGACAHQRRSVAICRPAGWSNTLPHSEKFRSPHPLHTSKATIHDTGAERPYHGISSHWNDRRCRPQEGSIDVGRNRGRGLGRFGGVKRRFRRLPPRNCAVTREIGNPSRARLRIPFTDRHRYDPYDPSFQMHRRFPELPRRCCPRSHSRHPVFRLDLVTATFTICSPRGGLRLG
jgi:hypothetical protein